MESHHSHHPDGYRDHKKKWSEYLLEFFMLFLAVFLGFVAENIRENITEKHREKEYIKSLVKDLQLDIAWLDSVTHSARARIQNLDSAISEISSGTNEISLSGYLQLRRSTTQIMFFPNNGTLTQLKNSGGLRLIGNRPVVDSIEAYDRLERRLEVRRDITNEAAHDFTNALNKAVSGADLLESLYDSTFFGKNTQKNTAGLKGEFVNELINHIISLRLRAVSDTNANFYVKNSASILIDFLKKEYHLDNN